MSFRSVFFGTPAFAVPCLDALADISEIVAVVCQPDKPSGRGLTLTAPPVKQRAVELGIDVHQPTKLRTGEFAEWLRQQNVDVAVVVAYGRILPEEVLAAPRLRCVNVHGSLLPRYRGAAPITWSIVRGDAETGITLMQMDAGMDTGAMLERFPTPIDPNETAGELAERLSAIGALAVRKGLPKVLAGTYIAEAQNDAEATTAPMLKKEDGRIVFAGAPKRVHDHVRGMNPWPGAFTTLRGKTLKIHATKLTELQSVSHAPGTVVLADKSRVLVACHEGTIELVTVQLEGKKAMKASDLVLGRAIAEGDLLGSAPA